MMNQKIPLIGIHHVAIICSNYELSKQFYTEILGFEEIREVYRKERDSYKLDLSFQGVYFIELFSFPETPARISRPEACGLRHIAFEVSNLDDTVHILQQKGLICEDIRIDEFTGKRFTFTSDPDLLPIEFYER
ncbi:SMU1112c/YaeR family gloxylase I-like metalloprotein [Aquirufa aurantiipilula]|uniref:SMU1112c/YaeR family gloxylase I-like metalloprotein n=1 Tax=Aquirufa aurantiipilula TaxID=2696561 RepID=UPI0021D454FD|nr:VOC family protein [Aquirufa aurantiipilula]